MVIPKHKVCDLCEQPVGVNNRYYIIKSKNLLIGYGGSCHDNKTHHICEECMYAIAEEIRSRKKKNEVQYP